MARSMMKVARISRAVSSSTAKIGCPEVVLPRRSNFTPERPTRAAPRASSGRPLLKRRVQAAEPDPGVNGREPPLHLDFPVVPVVHPGVHLPPQLTDGPDPSAQALAAQGRQLALGHVQP